jgi:acyl-coenzyme A synthetase/AMP-(fatty) acid ligase
MDPASQSWLHTRLTDHGAKSFLHTVDGSATYADLVIAIAAQRAELRRANIAPGAPVLLAGDYSLPAIALFLALLENRNMIVPAATTVETEISQRIAISGATHLARAAGAGFEWSRLAPPAAAKPHPLFARLVVGRHAGLVLFSSGSTGQPKAMVHNLDLLLGSYHDRRVRSLTLLVFLLFDHIGGLNTLFTALTTGSALVVPALREPEHICMLVARHRVTILPASPTFLNLLLLSEAWTRYDLSSLRIITYGTEPMPESLLARLRAAFRGVKFIQTFGTSETGISHTTSKSSDSTLLKLEDPNLEHRVVEGELWLRSRTQILGYLNHAMNAFTDDGWFRTGDLVEEAGDGFWRIIGRRNDVINVGGEKVLPGEIESVLLMMPEIADCLVYGEASPITGQIVCAQVVPAPGADAGTMRLLVRTFCRTRLAPYKVPVKVQVVAQTTFGNRFKKMRNPAPPAPAP